MKETMNKVLQITKENVYPLPFAFSSVNFGPGNNKGVNKPSPNFYKKVTGLKERILSFRPQTEYTMNEFFKFAGSFWGFTQRYSQLTDYQSLPQKKEDQKVIAKVE